MEANQILIVDDSPLLRRTIRRAVTQAGADETRIQEAENGSDALEQVKVGNIGLVLLDLNMPVLNGEEFLEALRGDPANENLPVIVVSTESNEARLKRIRSFSIAGFLRKPFPPEDLLKLVGSFLNS